MLYMATDKPAHLWDLKNYNLIKPAYLWPYTAYELLMMGEIVARNV